MPYEINTACTKCGACITECPTNSIIEGETQYYIDSDTCLDHMSCVNVCPVDAIKKLKEDPSSRRDEEEE